MTMSMSTRVVAALATGLALVAGGAAQAASPNYIFPSGSPGFALVSHGGPINPGVLVGFNPQPEPPGKGATFIDLSRPFAPELINPSTGPGFSFLFALTGLGDAMIPLPGSPNADGRTRFRQEINGHLVDVTLVFGPGPVDPGSWVAFNPQPDPPGDAFGASFLFAGKEDPFAGFTVSIDGTRLSFTLAGVPEPASWALMIAGFGLVGATLRSRRRIAQA
jgi:hypothetical protein